MSLRFRTLLILGLTVVASIVCCFVVVRKTLDQEIQRVNNHLAREHLERGMIALSSLNSELRALVVDYAAWDDTYEYMVDRNPSYLGSNFVPEMFSNCNIDLALLISPQGELAYSGAPGKDGKVVPCDPAVLDYRRLDSALLSGQTVDDLRTGLLYVGGRLIELAVCPILDSRNDGPSRGTLVLGRKIGPSELESIGQASTGSMQLTHLSELSRTDSCLINSPIYGFGDPCIRPESNESLTVCTKFKDILGNPVLLLRLNLPNEFGPINKRLEMSLVFVLLIVGAAFGVVQLIQVSSTVLTPLQKLSRSVAAIGSEGDFGPQLKVSGGGEISVLVSSVNQMLEKLESAYKRLRASEQSYRQLVELAQEGISTVDENEVITFVNPAFCRMFGYERDELIGRRVTEIIDPAQHEEVFRHTTERRAGQTSTYELRMLTRNGEPRHCIISVGPLFDAGGNYAGAIAGTADITESRRTEQLLLHSQKLESLGVLAGGIAHDFNNILVSILGNAHLLLNESNLSPAQRQLVNDILSASHQASELTREMLAYSGRGKFVIKPLELDEVCLETINMIRAAVPKRVSIDFDGNSAGFSVNGDVAQVRQVLMNLIVNAAEAYGRDSGVVTIRTSVVEAGTADLVSPHVPDTPAAGTYVLCEVHDQAHGMDRSTVEKLFDPFFTTKATGRGLGLSAVLGIVIGHQGTIQLETSPGVGSTFRVFLPAAAVSNSDAVPKTTPQLAMPAGKVLVVDDEETVRKVLRSMLQRQGVEVMEASNGDEAIELLAQNERSVSLVLLDLTMPGRDTRSTLSELHRLSPDLPVVLMSGYSNTEVSQSIGDNTVAGFLGKPFSPAQLNEVMARHWDFAAVQQNELAQVSS